MTFFSTIIKIKYISIITLVFIFFLVELIVGIIANSIILQTDAFHMLSDLIALCIGYYSAKILNKINHRYTYGYLRADIVSGLINSVFLLAICFILFIESIETAINLIQTPTNSKLENNIEMVLGVSIGGLIINIIGMTLFHSHSNNAEHAVYLHIIGDTLGSILAIINSIIVKFTDWRYKFFLDPLLTMIIVVFISISSLRLLKKSCDILMHKWIGQNKHDILTELSTITEIVQVHDFHLLPLNESINLASLHIQISSNVDIEQLEEIFHAIKLVLHKYSIHHSTIQPEWTNKCSEPTCETDCSHKKINNVLLNYNIT